jgi:hypothetical protein
MATEQEKTDKELLGAFLRQRGSLVRRPRPYKQIPKKGLGGLIPNYKANLRRP